MKDLIDQQLEIYLFFQCDEKKLGKDGGVLRGKFKKEFNLGHDKFEIPGRYLNDSDEQADKHMNLKLSWRSQEDKCKFGSHQQTSSLRTGGEHRRRRSED